jgi:diguanylate cyclase (GGDEF)-like protein/PAS domain S-box-containing protein
MPRFRKIKMQTSLPQSSAVHPGSNPNPGKSFATAPKSRDGGLENWDSSTTQQLQLVHAQLGIVSSLYVSLRAKHGPVASHSLRVAMWASAWGIKNKLPEEHLQLLEIVGLLHDIGKIGIPDRVLQKPDRLTDHEQSMMDLHPQVGIEILRAAGASELLLLAIAGIGTNYKSSNNHGSKEIAPLISRLINIVDAYDSMTVQQVYREPSSRESALAEIFRNGGSQFDPVLVRSFAEMVLDPKINLQIMVSDRWLNQLERRSNPHFFDTSGIITLDSSKTDRTGSALVQTLNDTFYRHMMDHVQYGVIFIDSENRILDWNTAAERMTGRSAESIFHQYWNPSLANLSDSDGFAISDHDCPFLELMQSGIKIERRLAIRRENVPLLHVDVEVVPVLNDRGHLCGGAIILEDISETADLEQRIVHLRERACQDQLTKVANRGELNRQLTEFVTYHQRNGHSGSVIICDIDFFKRINDNFSHQAGDEALIAFAQILKDCCRETDFVARYGGEEFVMLCGECDLTEAKEVAETIRKKVSRTPIAAIRNATMTASFGVSTILPGDTDETVLGRADQGLMIAKESGRDRVVGLGLDDKPKDDAETQATSGWIGWLNPVKKTSRSFELLTNVPRAVTLEKLKGFVKEYKAHVVSVDNDSVVMDIDCRVAPIPQTVQERMGTFQLKVTLSELELESNSRNKDLKTGTHLAIELIFVRGRDRRIETIQSQLLRLKTSFQGWIVGIDMDDSIRAKIVRKIKPETDSRY